MDSIPRSISIVADDAYSAGYQLGEQLGGSFSAYLSAYAERRIASIPNFSVAAMERRAEQWITALPAQMAERFRGLADGCRLQFRQIAVWGYLEPFLEAGCSSVVCRSERNTWLAHNNDTFVPELWGHVTVLNIRGRIPTMQFGLAGDIWTTAGINQAQLWLHVDHLPAFDQPASAKPVLPGYGLIVEALETCRTIDEVEQLFDTYDRTAGMILVAVDGKSNQAAAFECQRSSWTVHPLKDNWLVRTNHAVTEQPETPVPTIQPLDTRARFDRLSTLLRHQYLQGRGPTVADLRSYLADGQVERRDRDFATAYSAISCPAHRYIEFTFGGVPSASAGRWDTVAWPW